MWMLSSSRNIPPEQQPPAWFLIALIVGGLAAFAYILIFRPQ